MVVKNPSDFVGSVLGGSEQNTKGILASTAGKVLVIDEAYGLLGGSTEGGGPQSDPYKQAVIDTIGQSMLHSLLLTFLPQTSWTVYVIFRHTLSQSTIFPYCIEILTWWHF